MARFDVYATAGKGRPSYVLDVQADILQDLDTRVVVPLSPMNEAPRPARGLNPAFDIEGRPHLMLTQFVAAIPTNSLRDRVTSMKVRSDDVMRALDTLLSGY